MMFNFLLMLMPFLLLLFKHLIIDFFLQTPNMAINKGKYGHWGGISHALEHVVGTIAVIAVYYWMIEMPMQFFLQWCVLATCAMGLVDGLIHYHMDWFKVWWCNKKNYKSHPDLGCTVKQSKSYWRWLGIDQTVHILTYVGLWSFVMAWIQVGKMTIYGG